MNHLSSIRLPTELLHATILNKTAAVHNNSSHRTATMSWDHILAMDSLPHIQPFLHQMQGRICHQHIALLSRVCNMTHCRRGPRSWPREQVGASLCFFRYLNISDYPM